MSPKCVPAADILVQINDTCVLGRSHKEVVEMLKSVLMGQSVDVVLRRGYPMLYNPDGCPKQTLEKVQVTNSLSDSLFFVIVWVISASGPKRNTPSDMANVNRI